MSEKIKGITEWAGRLPGKSYGSHAGFRVSTDERDIFLAISDDPCCCESWGFFLTEDDTSKFVGEELRGVAVADTNRSTKEFGDWNSKKRDNFISLDAGDVMFVDIQTSRGVLQFVAYNAHNGYYGHSATVVSSPHGATSEVLVEEYL